MAFGGRGEKQEARIKNQEGRVVSLPVLKIGTPLGNVVELNGKIDRVDASEGGRGREVAVVDYKSAAEKKLEMYLVYWGLALQLPVYGVVMEALWKKETVAALYVPLGMRRKSVKGLAEAAERGSDAFYQRQKVKGVVDAEGARHLDEAVGSQEEGGKSAWYGIGYNQDGSIAKSGDMIAHGDFERVLGYVRWKIGRMVDDLMGGLIGPAPYRDKSMSPCERCDFVSLCPFDRVNGVYRDVPRMKREEALEAMRAAMEAT